MDYVEERAKLYELNKVVKMWERKVEIAKVGQNVPSGRKVRVGFGESLWLWREEGRWDMFRCQATLLLWRL